ncbi:MAG: hypothetical protein SFV51_22960 [Bryobacteraceae bacterium]|nr:hypothetical protein [Bryobacteraceae bacterium]
MSGADLYEFLSRHRLGVLATVTATGVPQSALVGIAVTPELELVFDTLKTTRGLLAGDALRRYREVYFRARPDGPDRLSWPGIVYFAVRPKWIRYSDFAVDPPLIHEVSVFGQKP